MILGNIEDGVSLVTLSDSSNSTLMGSVDTSNGVNTEIYLVWKNSHLISLLVKDESGE